MGDALLQVREVAKSYGAHVALDGVSLDVAGGEICGLLGPNGAGKTSLVSIIAGLRSADRGTVLLDGIDVATGGAAARELVGLAGQETAIYPTVTVAENLLLFADLAGLRGAERTRRIEEIASVLELTELMGRAARHLSGGEKRRLHTAMALVHRPRIVLLDEPTTGVDITTRQRLLDAVRRFAAEDGAAVVYSTHYLPEIEQLDATVVVLDHGRVLTRGTVAELLEAHAGGSVEITLTSEPPALDVGEVVRRDQHWVVRVRGDQPGTLLATAMAALGEHAARVVDVSVLQPSLDTVFLEVTGRRFDESVDDDSAGAARAAGDDADGSPR